MGWRLVADVLLGLHDSLLVFLLLGGFLGRLRWVLVAHVLTVAWGADILTVGQPRALTVGERWARLSCCSGHRSGRDGARFPRRERLTRTLTPRSVPNCWAGSTSRCFGLTAVVGRCAPGRYRPVFQGLKGPCITLMLRGRGHQDFSRENPRGVGPN